MPVTNSGGFITGMTRELIAVQLPDLCPTACRHSAVYIYWYDCPLEVHYVLFENTKDLSVILIGIVQGRVPPLNSDENRTPHFTCAKQAR